MPKILKNKDELGEFIPQGMVMLRVTNYSMLNPNIDIMDGVEMRMDTFIKEAKALIDARYNKHSTKIQKLLDAKWLIEDEYNIWLEKFID